MVVVLVCIYPLPSWSLSMPPPPRPLPATTTTIRVMSSCPLWPLPDAFICNKRSPPPHLGAVLSFLFISSFHSHIFNHILMFLWKKKRHDTENLGCHTACKQQTGCKICKQITFKNKQIKSRVASHFAVGIKQAASCLGIDQ